MTIVYIAINDLDLRGANAPSLSNVNQLGELPNGTAACLKVSVGRGLELQALVLIKERGLPLIAQFHGALDKQKYAPPRYERLATLRGMDVNTVLFADPTIMLDSSLQLGWYTGWGELDLHALIGRTVQELSSLLASPAVIVTGSSGGGFAALQVAPYIQGSISVPMNPQTSVAAYRIEGIHMGPQNTYRRIVMPELGDPGVESSERAPWWAPMAHRISAVERYSIPQQNSVAYWQNVNDVHHYEDHFKPFLESYQQSGATKMTFTEYEGPAAHVQPTPEIYLNGIIAALAAGGS